MTLHWIFPKDLVPIESVFFNYKFMIIPKLTVVGHFHPTKWTSRAIIELLLCDPFVTASEELEVYQSKPL